MPLDSPRPAGRAGLRVLAIGAHPDDVEIGAAALLGKLRDHGHEVHILVLTDDPANRETRRAEARNGAAELGIGPDRVLFAGIEQGYLRGDIDEVRLVRELMGRLDLQPDLVVTHTGADSHNDHGAANRVAHAAFRDRVFLHYSTHVSAEISHFRPTVFVEVTPDRLLAKDRALKCYTSQASRIGRHDLAAYEELLGRRARLDRAEGFEVGLQYGATEVARKTIALSDSPFHRFWLPTVHDGRVTLLYEAHTAGRTPAAFRHQDIARDALRQAFVEQWSPYPLRERCSDTDEALAPPGAAASSPSAARTRIRWRGGANRPTPWSGPWRVVTAVPRPARCEIGAPAPGWPWSARPGNSGTSYAFRTPSPPVRAWSAWPASATSRRAPGWSSWPTRAGRRSWPASSTTIPTRRSSTRRRPTGCGSSTCSR